MNSEKKRTLGSFYTQGNPFLLDPFIKWAETLPTQTKFLEPFAGNGQIPKLLTEAGFDFSWDSFDIDPEIKGVISQDTLSSFPQGYACTITNPPYLSYHFAKRKGINLPKEYFLGYPSLYLRAIKEALDNCDFVAMIIPESFITSGYFRERLTSFISLPFQMFNDTEMPTCLALWNSISTGEEFEVWRENIFIGNYAQLSKSFSEKPCVERIHFNVLDGQIGLKAIDNTVGPSIAFCDPSEIDANKIKISARLVSRIYIDNLTSSQELIDLANRRLEIWRQSTQDVLLTAFKGIRKDGQFRRRLDFANARLILADSLCELEGHNHHFQDSLAI